VDRYEREDDGEAARLLDRVAGEVLVPPAPVGRVVGAGRRQLRRRLLTVATVAVLLLLVLLAFLGG
jgi:hypothetical protein